MVLQFCQTLMAFCSSLLVLVCVCGGTVYAASPSRLSDEEIAAVYGPAFSIRVVDEFGQPVEGALAGLNCIKRSDGWTFGCNEEARTTDANGIVTLPKGARLLLRARLVAIHETRRLAGVELPIGEVETDLDEPQVVVARPARQVSGTVSIRELEQNGKSPGAFGGSFVLDDHDPFQWSTTTDRFELLLPPGEYTLVASGTYGEEIERPIRVEAGDATLQLEPINLLASSLGLMLGRPAPELRDIVDWKNSKGVKLSDMRGHHVLLHFWGHWCGPCIARMPNLFAARDRFPEEKLAIVAVHVGSSSKTEAGEVDTVAELDLALTETREGHWQGRDLPFPVALVKAERTPHHRGEKQARSAAAADFGVRSYPTTILIDPHGRIVSEADYLVDSDDYFEKLSQLIEGASTKGAEGGVLKKPVLPEE